MLYINKTRSEAGRVNIKELQEVREQHMPLHAVRFAKPCQLQRVAAEITRLRPELREEAEFVVQEELGRRERLATTPMRLVEGSSHNA